VTRPRLFRAEPLARATALAALAIALLVGTARGARAEDPECARALERALKLAEEAESTGDLGAARRAWELLATAERRCPDNFDYPFWGCVAHVLGRDLDGAMESLNHVVALFEERARQLNRPVKDVQNEPAVLFLRAAIDLYLLDQPGRAVDRLKQVVARNAAWMPDRVRTLSFRAHLLFGNALAGRGDFQGAVAQALLALDDVRTDVTDKRRLQAKRNLAQLLRLGDRYKEAQVVWEELLAKDPNDVTYRYGIATVLADQLQFDAALPHWVETIRLMDSGKVDPADAALLADTRLRYGVCLAHAGKVAEGRKVLEAFAAAHPDDGRPHYFLARLHFDQLEDPTAAATEGEKARALDPWCETTLRLLLQIYSAAKPDPAKAKELQSILEDETTTKERAAEMERRKSSRRDRTNGCE
jgi:tetratricopeptide (TPR) repeat protein